MLIYITSIILYNIININELTTKIKLKIEEIRQPVHCYMVQEGVIDEIKKYEILLDKGIITKKEFIIKENEIIKSNKNSLKKFGLCQ